MDESRIAESALNEAERIVPAWLPEGKRVGAEWVALNPTRPDQHLGSFSVNLITGKWADFATDAKGGDLISLYMYIHSVDKQTAVKKIRETIQPNITKEDCEWVPITPIPSDALSYQPEHGKLGQPALIWTYRDKHGKEICRICRFETSRGKVIRPLTCARNIYTGEKAWRWMGIKPPYPLYQLDAICDPVNAQKIIIVCEGEKSADAAQKIFDDTIGTTSMFGAQSPSKTDWSPLAGRIVWIWPDADDAGKKYLQTVAKILSPIAAKIKVVEFTAPKPQGWDAADALSEGFDPSLNGYKVSFLPVPDPKKMPPGEWALTDTGNAERLVDRYRDDIRYCPERKQWYIWNGHYWSPDIIGDIHNRAKDVVRSMYSDVQLYEDPTRRQALVAHALKSESGHKRYEMVRLAQTEKGIPVLVGTLDQNPWLINCDNGTLDLRTQTLNTPRRQDLITKSLKVPYDPSAQCPLWLKTLDKIFDGKQPLIKFLQRAVGYTLTGNIEEQALFVLWGSGANGKSTILSAIQSILGPYATTAAPNLLISANADRHPTELADLRGARLVTSVETSDGNHLAEALVKQVTGGEKIKARFMREDFFEFTPTFKFFIATNHKPLIKGADYAIWRRIRLIPFTVTIPPEERDKTLLQKLLSTEAAGILRWAVDGCAEWLRIGLDPPEEVVEATKEYKTDMDIIGAWLDDCCILLDGIRTKSSVLYQSYAAWASNNGERTESQRRFGSRLLERGFTRERGTANQYYWYGIGLTAQEEAGF